MNNQTEEEMARKEEERIAKSLARKEAKASPFGKPAAKAAAKPAAASAAKPVAKPAPVVQSTAPRSVAPAVTPVQAAPASAAHVEPVRLGEPSSQTTSHNDSAKLDEERKQREQAEADRRKQEDDDRKKREQHEADERKQREQAEADRRRQEEEERHRREQAEADRRKQEDEERKKREHAEAEERRRQEMVEADRRRQEEDEKKRKHEEDERRRKEENDAALQYRGNSNEEVVKKEEERMAKALKMPKSGFAEPSQPASGSSTSAVDVAARAAEDQGHKQRSEDDERRENAERERALFSGGDQSEQVRREEERIRKQFAVGSGGPKKQADTTPATPTPTPVASSPASTATTKSAQAAQAAVPKLSAPVSVDPFFSASINGPLEKEILAELNHARSDPQAFATVLKNLEPQYSGKTFSYPGTNYARETVEGVAAVHEAIKFLEAQQPNTKTLRLDSTFSQSALDLVKDHGPRGLSGENLSDGTEPSIRLIKYGAWKKKVAEIVAYGPLNARSVVSSWIIDDGNAARSSRNSIFDRDYSVIGAASGPHSQFGKMYVVDWAVEYNPKSSNKEAPSGGESPQEESKNEHKTGTLKELPDGTFEIDVGVLDVPKENIQVKLKKGNDLQITKKSPAKTSTMRYELPFAFRADLVTAHYGSDKKLLIKLRKPAGSGASGEVTIATFSMAPSGHVDRVNIEIQQTKQFLSLKAVPSKFHEDVAVKVRDGKVIVWECKHYEEIPGEESRKIITATQTLPLPFEVSPASVSVSLHGDQGATTQVPVPSGGTGEVDIPVQ